jgi:hypothetical protein
MARRTSTRATPIDENATPSPPTVDLQQTRDVLEQMEMIQRMVDVLSPSSVTRTRLLSAHDRLALLLPESTSAASPLPGGVSAPPELSGPAWVSRFPGSASPDDCIDPFKSNLKAFLAALADARAQVSIASTFRPPERAFLMYWSWKISKNIADPRNAGTMPGVAIEWVHRDSTGNPDIPASRSAASRMVSGYGLVSLPALISRHTQRRAVDMVIGWPSILSIRQSDGGTANISTEPRSGMNDLLIQVGSGYGVIKAVFEGDPPHWSDDGH